MVTAMLASVSQTFWKRNCRMKTIVILRSQSIPEDSRVTKWISELVRLGYTVKALGWDRMDKYNASETLDVNGTSVDIKYFKQPCTFGGGMKNLKKMIFYLFMLMKKENLIKQQGKLIMLLVGIIKPQK